MILFELTLTEEHSAYQALEISNGGRQYDFLRSIVTAAVAVDRGFLSQTVIKALNYQAIACLHTNAGDYRPCEVEVGDYRPPQHFRVQALMDDFVNQVNLAWNTTDALALASYVLWRMNNIHPFINGNGRTARAACYFVLCVKSGGWIAGQPILPERIRGRQADYVSALKKADRSATLGEVDLGPLHELLSDLMSQQLTTLDA